VQIVQRGADCSNYTGGGEYPGRVRAAQHHGQTDYRWRNKYGGAEASVVRRPKEQENAELKQLVGEQGETKGACLDDLPLAPRTRCLAAVLSSQLYNPQFVK